MFAPGGSGVRLGERGIFCPFWRFSQENRLFCQKTGPVVLRNLKFTGFAYKIGDVSCKVEGFACKIADVSYKVRGFAYKIRVVPYKVEGFAYKIGDVSYKVEGFAYRIRRRFNRVEAGESRQNGAKFLLAG